MRKLWKCIRNVLGVGALAGILYIANPIKGEEKTLENEVTTATISSNIVDELTQDPNELIKEIISVCKTKQEMQLIYEKKVQELKDAGIPTSLEQLLIKIPDTENGVLVYKKAFQQLEISQQEYPKEWECIPPIRKFCGENVCKFRTWENIPETTKKGLKKLFSDPNSDKLYETLKKASGMNCRFLSDEEYAQLGSSPNSLFIDQLNQLMEASSFLISRAQVELKNNKIKESYDTCLTSIKFAKSLSNEPLLRYQIPINSAVLQTVPIIKELMEKQDPNDIGTYQAILDELKNIRQKNISAYAIKGEIVSIGLPFFLSRTNFPEEYFKAGDKEKKEAKKFFGTDPLKFGLNQWKIDFTLYADSMFQIVPLAEKQFFESGNKIKSMLDETNKSFPDNNKQLTSKGIYLSPMIIEVYYNTYEKEAVLDAVLGAAEIAISNRLYKKENGKYADSLEQLVPQNIANLPTDPFTGKAYLYQKRGEGFKVYSSGKNLEDNGGDGTIEMVGMSGPDIVFELAK
ncbi:MAG: hypothetical protein PHH54_04075 [Candidatus Nanoarchaeia archaeon]|nr:hypothetical protein [Candidatus Nanoarchaeia archaeon]MDD5741137.1 hypothetical protein [Candidatus Nanoarchaeia archaeon]